MGTGDAILKTEFWLKITQAAWATNRTGIHYDAFHPEWHAYGMELNHCRAISTISNAGNKNSKTGSNLRCKKKFDAPGCGHQRRGTKTKPKNLHGSTGRGVPFGVRGNPVV
jgi:hypothetical protein